MGQIERLPDHGALDYGASVSAIGPFKTDGMTQLWLDLPAEFNGDTLSLTGSSTENGTYTAVTGSDFSWTGITGWNQVPPPACTIPFLKLVTDTPTAAAGSIRYARKS